VSFGLLGKMGNGITVVFGRYRADVAKNGNVFKISDK
jgi:hypothetical protein